METRFYLATTLLVASIAGGQNQQRNVSDQEWLWQRILRMSETEQLAYLDQRLNQGFRQVNDDALAPLLQNRSALVVPIIERKIEEVLRSRSPADCFSDKLADPQAFIDIAAIRIWSVGDENSLRAASRLLAIDEKRFDFMVRNTFFAAYGERNPMALAYKGLEIGDPAVDRRILAWVEQTYNPRPDPRVQRSLENEKQWWADALLERCHGVPIDADWNADPIASRINLDLAKSLKEDILRKAAEAASRPAKK